MKNTFGTSVTVTLFGESHGEAVGAVLDGFAPGVPIDGEKIAKMLSRRRSVPELSTARRENDPYRIVSGVFSGYTTGTPLTVLIPNENARPTDYDALKNVARPSHADYAAYEKYHGFADPNGGGHFSGRLTAPLVVLGAIAETALETKKIRIGAHISSLFDVKDRDFGDCEADFDLLSARDFPTLDDLAGERMKNVIRSAASEKDSVGGTVGIAVTGLPVGVGEPFFDGVESVLAHALLSVPAVKGVEFGDGFALAAMKGSEANDPFAVENGKIVTKTNRSGGLNGGITNGMPLVVRCAIKPTPSIGKPQNTVDFVEKTEKSVEIGGRHDPAIVHRAVPALEAVTALAICDLLACRFGTDYLMPGKKD